jgi:hypothetical protein
VVDSAVEAAGEAAEEEGVVGAEGASASGVGSAATTTSFDGFNRELSSVSRVLR